MTLLDYCLRAGSEHVVRYFRDNLYIVNSLREFRYIDKYGNDQGASVRQKANDIANLLSDDTRLQQERGSRTHLRDLAFSRTFQDPQGNTADDDLRKAIEESQRTVVFGNGDTQLSTHPARDVTIPTRPPSPTTLPLPPVAPPTCTVSSLKHGYFVWLIAFGLVELQEQASSTQPYYGTVLWLLFKGVCDAS